MAHIPHQDIREQRRRRRNALLCLLLFIPAIAAGYFYFRISTSRLSAAGTQKIVMTYGESSETLTEKPAIARVMNALESAKKITQSARPLSEYNAVRLDCSDEFTALSYTLYLSHEPGDCLMADSENGLYSLTQENAEELLCAEEFSFLYRTAPDPMQLQIGEDVFSVAPSYTWHYLLPDGTERETSAAPEPETHLAAATLPAFTVPGDPDDLKLFVTVDGEVKTGTLGELATLLPANATGAEIAVAATWSNPEADGYYGTVQYRFLLRFTPAA